MDDIDILIVEDASGITEPLRPILQQLGYKAVETVPAETDMLKEAAARRPDLLITTLHSPWCNEDRQILWQIRKLHDVAIISVFTHEEGALDKAKAMGATGFLFSPFEPADLEIALDAALYRQEKEQLLRDNELQVSNMLAMAADAVISVDEAGTIHSFNHGAETVFGYSAAEIIGKKLGELLPAESVEIYRQYMRAIRSDDDQARHLAERQVEIIGRRRDGSTFPAEVSIAGLTLSDRTHYAAVLRDISKRKRMEEELRLVLSITQEVSTASDFPTAIGHTLATICQSMDWEYGESWLSLQNTPELIYDCHWYIDHPGFQQFHQLSAAFRFAPGIGLPGKAWSSRKPEWLADLSSATRRRFPRAHLAAEAGFKTGFAIPITLDDQGVVVLTFFSTRARPADNWLLEMGQTLSHHIGTVLQQKQAEERLHKLSSVVEHTADMVLITNREGIIEYVNPAFVQLTGYAEDEVLGKTPRLLKSGKHDPQFYAALWETMHSGQAFHGIFVNRKKHRELYYEEKTIIPLRNAEGDVTHFVATSKDITERRQLEDRIAAIYKLGQELTLIRDETVIVERVLKTSARLLRIKEAACGLVIEADHELVYPFYLAGRRTVPTALRLPLADRYHTGPLVARGGEAIMTPNHVQEVTSLTSVLDLPPGSELCVPIKVGRQVLGVLHVLSPHLDHFTAADQQLLQILADQAAVALENARLFKHVEQRNLELNRLDNALEMLFPSTLAGVDALAQTIVKIILREFNHSNCSLILIEQGSNKLARIAVAGPFSTQVSQRRLRLDGPGLIALAIRTGQILNIPDVRLHPDYLAIWPPALSELTIPLKIGPMVIGAIDLQSAQLAAFSPEDERLLSVFAERAALALENSRLYSETRQRARELAILNKVGQEMASSLDLNVILNQIMDEIKALFDAEAASVLLRDVATDELVFSAVASPASESLVGVRLPISQGIAGWVVREMRPLLVNDARQDHRFYVNIDNMTGMTTRSLLAVPLVYNEVVTGVIEVVNRQSGVFDQQNLEMLAALASSAAIAIENARLFETEQKQYRRLQESQAQLIQAEKLGALGRLGASIAHEINNPLQSMQGFLALVQEELEGKRRQEKLDRYLSIVNDEIERIAAIVHRMRDFYRPAQPAQRATNLHAILHDVLALTNNQLQHSHVVVERHWQRDLPALSANPDHLKQVFLNLILNSIDALPEGGVLTISTRPDEMVGHSDQQARPAIRIDFRDNGIGMSTETLAHLFEPFFTTKTSGSGLGLSVSYGIIESHGGKISVASELGDGSTFTIWLPLVPPSTEQVESH